MITLALVDDHILLRKSMAVMLNRMPGFKVTIQASNGNELVMQLQTKMIPDLVLTDITMPLMDGMETTRWLKQRHKQVKVVALSMHTHETFIKGMLGNGAGAYLLKDMEPDDLAEALRQVYITGHYYNPVLSPFLHDNSAPVLLNEKELAFLRWTCTEKSHKEIAAEMCVSPRTIDGYRDSLFRKLKVGSRVGMVMYALKNDLVLLK